MEDLEDAEGVGEFRVLSGLGDEFEEVGQDEDEENGRDDHREEGAVDEVGETAHPETGGCGVSLLRLDGG